MNMSPQFSMSRVGADTAQLLDSDLQYIETQVTEAVRQKLIGRNLFAPVRLPDIGHQRMDLLRPKRYESSTNRHGWLKQEL